MNRAIGYTFLFGPAALVLAAAVALMGVPGTFAELLAYALAGAIAYTIAFGHVGR